VQVIADTENNAIVVLAVPQDFEVIEAAIKRLDIIQRQVLVEVTLAEFTLTDELQFGIEWFLNARSGRNFAGRLGGTTAPSISPPASPASVPAGRGLTLVRTLAGGQIAAILNLLESDSRAKIVATPSATVADNHPATIKVGTRVPVKSQSQSGITPGTLIESIQYIETGVLLEVTPRINSGSQVTLEINVEVSQARVNQSSNIDSPEVSNRSAKSLVTIGSGESVVLAGLIRQDNTNDSTGLPGLAKIPVFGGLFGRQSQTGVRTELVVLITPKVINDTRQAREITEELIRKVPLLQEMLPRAAPAANDARQRQ
jgi:general secretion pathway protein D